MRSTPPIARGRHAARRCTAIVLSALFLFGCASVEFERTEREAGTFHSSAWCLTFLGIDLPSNALMTARANASDSALPNMEVVSETRRPYLGRFNWILNLFSIRFASVEGTWGFPTHEP